MVRRWGVMSAMLIGSLTAASCGGTSLTNVIPDVLMPGGVEEVQADPTEELAQGFAAQEQLRTRFAYFDQNSDTFISQGEYFHRQRQNFAGVDTDGDGFVVGLCEGRRRSPATMLDCVPIWTEQFTDIARDDGVVTLDEFVGAGGF